MSIQMVHRTRFGLAAAALVALVTVTSCNPRADLVQSGTEIVKTGPFDIATPPFIVPGADGGGFINMTTPANTGRTTGAFWDNHSTDENGTNTKCNIGFYATANMSPNCINQAAGSNANATGGYTYYWGKGAGNFDSPSFMFSGASAYKVKLVGAYSSWFSNLGWITKDAGGGYVIHDFAPANWYGKPVNTELIIPAGANWGLFINSNNANDGGCMSMWFDCSDAEGGYTHKQFQQFSLFSNALGTKFLIGAEDNTLDNSINTTFPGDFDYQDYIITVEPISNPPQNTPCPAGSFSYQPQPNGDVVIIYDQFPAPNDNSYGVNSVGWGGINGHKFSNLTGSDHAGFQLRDGGGVVRLSFNIDYLTANPTGTVTPSGYSSLGPFGGDGKVLVGTLTPADIIYTTSLAKNLNETGYCIGGNCTVAGTNLLIDSPPTDAAHQTYTLANPAHSQWNFHNTYFVTIKAAKLASIGFNPATWSVQPNADQLHNSPAKACPTSTSGGGTVDVSVDKREVKDKQVKVTIVDDGTADAFIQSIDLTWPQGTNGNLVQVKLDGDVIYNGAALGGGSAHLSIADLVADQNKRKINHGSSDVLVFIFQNNAAAISGANYTGTVGFGSTSLVIFP